MGVLTGDICDGDDDNDGIDDLSDNCQYDYNRDQSDTDSDNIGKWTIALLFMWILSKQITINFSCRCLLCIDSHQLHRQCGWDSTDWHNWKLDVK